MARDELRNHLRIFLVFRISCGILPILKVLEKMSDIAFRNILTAIRVSQVIEGVLEILQVRPIGSK